MDPRVHSLCVRPRAFVNSIASEVERQLSSGRIARRILDVLLYLIALLRAMPFRPPVLRFKEQVGRFAVVLAAKPVPFEAAPLEPIWPNVPRLEIVQID